MPSPPRLSPVPPPRGSNTVDLLRLHLSTLYHSGLGRALLERYGSASGALRSPPSELREVPGMKDAVLERLLSLSTKRLAEEEATRAKKLGVSIHEWGTESYPLALADLPGMPALLYAGGGLLESGRFPLATVGVVGSRKPTPYGVAQAQRFAGALAARGFAIVSGLALGIDGEAHRAALDAGGSTVAVLGSGLDRIYPDAHQGLADRIAQSERCALLSEFPLATAPKSFHFPMRNRILSGLSQALLVIEAGEKSGSLITVTHALEQGKTVYVLPGRVDRPESLGCLRLLMDGAFPVITPDDVLPGIHADGALPGARLREATQAAPGGGALPAKLPGRLGERLGELFAREDSLRPDDLADRLDASPQEVLRELSRLELDGFLQRLPGGAFAIAPRNRPGERTRPE